jgi:hypothetical protein
MPKQTYVHPSKSIWPSNTFIGSKNIPTQMEISTCRKEFSKHENEAFNDNNFMDGAQNISGKIVINFLPWNLCGISHVHQYTL